DGGDQPRITAQIPWQFCYVRGLRRLLRLRRTIKGRIWTGMDDPRALLGIGGRRVVHCRSAEAVTLPQIKIAELGPTEAYGILQDCFKDRFQNSGRRADDTQHFRCSRLLLERLPQLVE